MAANSNDSTWSQAEEETLHGDSGKKKGLNLSFTKRIVLVTLAVSLITVKRWRRDTRTPRATGTTVP